MAVQLPKKSSALPWPALVPLGHHAGKPPISLQKMVMLVGSRHNAHLHLMSRHVSKAHALILSYGGSVYIRDLASREHVYINGAKQREAWLRNGDLIKIGSFTFKFKAGPPKVKAGADEPTDHVDLEIDGAEAPLSVAEKVMLIGRRPTCDVSLTEDSVSTAHAVIFHVGGRRYLRDLGSRTGTFVNGKKIHQQELNAGDELRIGETIVRYVLAEAHEHHIEPVDVGGGAGDVDELEHLVGTAPLDMAAEMRAHAAPADDEALERDLHAMAGGAAAEDELKPDDLIELEFTPDPAVAGGGRGVADDEPIAIEPEDELSVTAPADAVGGRGPVSSTAGAEPEIQEIDLSTDPDVADLPQSAAAADTRAIDMNEAPPPKPTLSERVVDELPVEDAGAADDEVDLADLLPLEDELATPPVESELGHDEVISPRGGWQRMSRVEDDTLAGELDAPLPVVGETAGEAEVAPAEIAPEVEEEALVDWAPEETPAVGGESVEVAAPELQGEAASEDDLLSILGDEGGTAGAEAELPVIEPAVEETPVDEPLVGDETPALDLNLAETVLEPALDRASVTGEPEQSVAEVSFEPSVVAAPEEVAESRTVTEPVAPVEPEMAPVEAEAPAVEPLVAETPAEPVIVDVPTGEAPAVIEEPVSAESLVGDAPVIEEMPPVEPEAFFAPVVEPEPEAFVAPVVDAEPEENFGKKGRARKGGKAKGEKKVVVPPVVKEKPAKGKGGRKPRKGVAAAAAAAAEEAEDVAEDGNVAAAGIAVGAGIVGAAIVAEKVGGEETNVVAAEQGATVDAAGDVAEVAEQGADVQIAAVQEIAPEPVADVESVVGAVAPETVEESATVTPPAMAEVETSVEGEVAREADVMSVSEAEAGEIAFVTEIEGEGAAMAAAAAEEPLTGDVGEIIAGEAELAVAEAPKAEDVTPFEVPAESVQSIGEAEAIEAPIEPLDLNESEATWSPGAVEESAGAAEDLSDSTFGRQMEAFTETSSGDLVEETPADEVEDADEALAIALSGAGDEVEDNTNVTAGGIEPVAEPLAAQQFEANGESVELDTPGLAEADAVLGGQEFVAEADEAHDVRTSATEEMGSQSFGAEAAADEVKEVAPRPEPVAPRQQPPQSVGGTGGFVIGTDLSSFIGGMPLVLPDLPPAPTGFGQVQVSFAGAKAPWQQAQRPAFPMGKSLAQEVMDAAEGLRDVEKMDAEQAVQEDAGPAEELGEESYTDDGAPGDEWNVAAVLEDEDEPVAAEWHPAEHTGEASMTGASSAMAANEADAESAEALAAGELSGEALVDEAPGAGNDDMLQEIELSGGFGIADADDDLAAGPMGVDEELTESQLLEITADQGALPEATLAQSATEADDGASGFEVEGSGDDFQEITIDELGLDEPEAAAPVAEAAPATDDVAGLDFDVAAPEAETEEAESVVDRSPPPPLAPLPPIPKKSGGRAVPPPPPPPMPAAKGGGRARGVEAPRSLSGAPPEDAIFGSLEHGKVAGGGAFGAAAGGVGEVDVFATPSAPEESDEVEGFGSGEASSGLAKARPEPGNGEAVHAPPTARRATRVIVPPKMDALGATPVTALSRGGGGGNRALGRQGGGGGPKKSAAGRVTWIVLLMLVSMGLAVGGIFYFLKVKQQSIGELHFQNVGALTKKQRNDLRQEQYDYLMTPNVRMTARGYVQAKGLPLGFLEAGEGEAERIARVHPGGLDDRTPAMMTVEYAGTDPLDKVRVHALLMAVYQENSSKVNESLRLNSEIGKIEQKLKEYQQVRERRDALKQIVDAAPSPETMAQLDAAVKQADAAYDSATQAVKEAQLDVRRAEEQLPGSPGEALLKSAGDGGNKATPADKELADLQKALEDAASRTADLKGAASAEADAKRKLLDQAVEAFQQTAAGLMRQNPQLAQYVQAVQQLQERTHKLGGDLIEVQQQQHKRLSALKKDMDEQVLARRQEIWAADKGLADLRAQLDLANRKYNAARDQGFTEDSREVRDALSEIKDLSARTDARKNELGKDPIVTKVAGALQELITITKERLDADRARIEKDIKDQEQAFAESGMIERLPAQQQSEAKALDDKQRAISDLRKQYAAALDRRTAESNAALRDLDAEVTTIRGKIDERKRMLAQEGAKNLTQQQETERRQLLERKQAAQKKAEDQLATAQRVYMDRNKALRNAKVALNEGQTARQEFEAIEQTLASKDEEAKLDKLGLDERRDKLQKIVKVDEPKESDVRVTQGRDDRMMYSLGAVMGLAVLFGVFAVFSVAGGEGRAARREAEAFDEDMDDGFEGGPMAIHEIGAREEEEAGQARY